MKGWRRWLLLYALGAMAALAMPPVFAFPLLVPSFCGLVLMLREARSWKQAALFGWLWGLGYFTVGLYWLCIALLTEPEKFAWLIPFTLIGLNGLFAIYTALAGVALYKLKPCGWRTPLVLAAVWTVMELARGHLFTGFPWNLPGYAWAFSDAMSQSVSVVGIYGLSFLTVLAAGAPLAGKRFALAAWLGLCVMAALGAWRLSEAPPSHVDGVRLRLVQANIAQHHRWNPRLQMQHVQKHLEMTHSSGFEDVTHVIWPETSVPYALGREATLIRLLMEAAPPGGALIVGSLRAEGEEESFRVWNTLSVIAPERGIVASYDKHHLVPFGEFMPLRALIPQGWFTPAGAVDFSSGSGARNVSAPGLPPFSPLICYEVIFPGEAVAQEGGRPGFLLSITNDAWFGASSGPYQHFHMARFRAIEQGLPMVRVANTGISAVVDAYGRVEAELGLNEEGVLDAPLPRALAQGTTYGRVSSIVSLF